MDSIRSNSPPETKIKPSSVPMSVNGGTSEPPKKGLTFANQDSLPKLPIPDLEQTCKRYLEALAPLQTPREQDETRAAVQDFLKSEGPILQEKLKTYASSKTSYIEQFCTSPNNELSLMPFRVILD